MENWKEKIEIIIDKIKVCFWEHEDFDDIRLREILEQELDKAREEGFDRGIEAFLKEVDDWFYIPEEEQMTEIIARLKSQRRVYTELTQKEFKFLNRLMVADRYGEDEAVKTEKNTVRGEEWGFLLEKLSKLTTK